MSDVQRIGGVLSPVVTPFRADLSPEHLRRWLGTDIGNEPAKDATANPVAAEPALTG